MQSLQDGQTSNAMLVTIHQSVLSCDQVRIYGNVSSCKTIDSCFFKCCCPHPVTEQIHSEHDHRTRLEHLPTGGQ